MREQMGGPAIKRSDTETYEKRLSTLDERVWADRTPVVWSGRMSNTAGALERPGVVEIESARLTQIKHKEIDTVFAFGCEKINIHYMGIQVRN